MSTKNPQLCILERRNILLSIKEVCEQLNISRWTLTKLIESGQIKAVKIEKQYRFKQSDIDEYLESCVVKTINA